MSRAAAALVALAAVGYVAKTQAPELRRYLKVRQM